MGRLETELCPQCGKRLPLLRRLSRSAFCSEDHESAYQRQQAALVLAALVDTERQLAQPRQQPKPLPKRVQPADAEPEMNLPVSGFLSESQEFVDHPRLAPNTHALPMEPAETALPGLPPPSRFDSRLATLAGLSVTLPPAPAAGKPAQAEAAPNWAQETLLPVRHVAAGEPNLPAGRRQVALTGQAALRSPLRVASGQPTATWNGAEPAQPGLQLNAVEPTLAPLEAALQSQALTHLCTSIQDAAAVVHPLPASPVEAPVALQALPVLAGSRIALAPVSGGGGRAASAAGSTAPPPRRRAPRKRQPAKIEAPAALRSLSRQLSEDLGELQPVALSACPAPPAPPYVGARMLGPDAAPCAPAPTVHAALTELRTAGEQTLAPRPPLSATPEPRRQACCVVPAPALRLPEPASGVQPVTLPVADSRRLEASPVCVARSLSVPPCEPEMPVVEPLAARWEQTAECQLPLSRCLARVSQSAPLCPRTEPLVAQPSPFWSTPEAVCLPDPPAAGFTRPELYAAGLAELAAGCPLPGGRSAPRQIESAALAEASGQQMPVPERPQTQPRGLAEGGLRSLSVARLPGDRATLASGATLLVAAARLPQAQLRSLWVPPRISAEPAFPVPPLVKWVFPLRAGRSSGPLPAERRPIRLSPALWGEWMTVNPAMPALRVRLQAAIPLKKPTSLWHGLHWPQWQSVWLSKRRLIPLAASIFVVFLAYRFQPALPNAKGKPDVATGEFARRIADRAAVHWFDDFHGGLGAWAGAPNWARSWQYGASGLVEPGQLALFAPTLGLHDYSIEFLGQIGRRSLNWAVRAADVKNYRAMRIVITKPGPQPQASIVRYAVVNGKEQAAMVLPLPMAVPNDLLFQVRTEVRGNDYTTYVQGQVVDHFSDGQQGAGGVGFFGPAGDRSYLHWVEVNHQYDYLGRLCALLAPYRVSPKGSQADRPN